MIFALDQRTHKGLHHSCQMTSIALQWDEAVKNGGQSTLQSTHGVKTGSRRTRALQWINAAARRGESTLGIRIDASKRLKVSLASEKTRLRIRRQSMKVSQSFAFFALIPSRHAVDVTFVAKCRDCLVRFGKCERNFFRGL